ncbi:MAG: transcription termination factor Rho [bacterium]
MTRHELEKMTVVKLREEALKYPELTGVHGMKKAELIKALAELMGLPEEEIPKKKVKVKKGNTKGGLKKVIKSLKEKRSEALKAKDAKALKIVRKRIKSAKRKLRKLVAA